MMSLGILASAHVSAGGGGGSSYTIAKVTNNAVDAGSTSLACTWPSGTGAGDAVLLLIGSKPYSVVPSAASDFTEVVTIADGTTAPGTGTGSMRSTSLVALPDSTKSGNVTVTLTGGDSAASREFRFTKSGGTWDVDGWAGYDGDATGTTVSVTLPTPDAGEGDMLVWAIAVPNDNTGMHTGMSVSVPGCTLGTVTWDMTTITATNTDCAVFIGWGLVASGSATGAATYTATCAESGRSNCAVTLTRLRAN